MALKRSSLENYVLLLQHVESMRLTTFNAKTFLKTIRPFCKTEHLKFKLLHIRVRGSNIGICINVKKDCFVVTQNGLLHEFIFYCDTSLISSKYLLLKLFKHNLLTR
jgi:hypothetical protein